MESAQQTGLMACATSGWEAETYTFYGTPEDIVRKVNALEIGNARRVFYLTIQAPGVSRIFEFERANGAVAVRSANDASGGNFDALLQSTMYENRGESCLGDAVQALSEYKSLNLEPVSTSSDQPNFGQIITEAINRGEGRTFARVAFHVLC
jgi:hypothetical protein